MHRLVIDVNENVLDKIIYFLNNLPKKDVKIVEDNIIDFSQFKVNAFKEIKDPVAWQQQIRDEWDRH